MFGLDYITTFEESIVLQPHKGRVNLILPTEIRWKSFQEGSRSKNPGDVQLGKKLKSNFYTKCQNVNEGN